MRYLIALLFCLTADAVELATGIHNFTLTQMEDVRFVAATNTSGANVQITFTDAPSTTLNRNVTNFINVHRPIGQAPSNTVVTNIAYKQIGPTVTISNNHYRLFPMRSLTYGLTVSNNGPLSFGTQ